MPKSTSTALARATSAILIASTSASCVGPEPAIKGESSSIADYFPTGTGTTWNFAVTVAPTTSAPSGSSYSVSRQITQGSPTTVTMKSLSDTATATTYSVQEYEITDTGVVASSSNTYNVMNDAFTYGFLYLPPELLLPSNIGPGSTASSTSTVTPQGATSVQPYALTRDIVVNGIESVTVPAGTFSALKVTTHITGGPANAQIDSYNVHWYAPGLGDVKIVTYPTATPTATTTSELTAHSP
jgi:hypothetical protein